MKSGFDSASDIAAWTLTGRAEVTDAYFPVSAPNVLFLAARSVGAGGVYRSEATRVFSVTPGMHYAVRMKANGQDSSNVKLELRLTDMLGTLLFTLEGPIFGGFVEWAPFQYSAIGNTVAVSLKTPYPQYTGGIANVGNWKVDDFELAEPPDVAKRRAIREAILTRLQTVTVAAGYAVGVGEAVFGSKRVPDEVGAWPHVELFHGEESKELQTLGSKESTLTFRLLVFCKRTATADPDDLCDDCCADIEKALELETIPGSAGPILGLSYIDGVEVTAVDPESLPEEIHRDIRLWVMTVDVTYTHARTQP